MKATTFNDPNDGGLYCYECWMQFYGSPPGAVRSAQGEADAGSEVKGLPEDAPRGHPAHYAVKYQSAKKVFSFHWQGAGGSRIPFQTTVPAAGNSRLAAEVIARACYMKFQQGWTKDKILEWRNQCYARLGGRAPSLLASQAASQRGLKTEASARSRSRQRSPQQHVQSPSPAVPKEARSRSHGTFLPPNHLKLLLDDPQAALPKSEVKIRSQGVAFSQSSNLKYSQDLGEDIFKSQEPQRQERQERQQRQEHGVAKARSVLRTRDDSGKTWAEQDREIPEVQKRGQGTFFFFLKNLFVFLFQVMTTTPPNRFSNSKEHAI